MKPQRAHARPSAPPSGKGRKWLLLELAVAVLVAAGTTLVVLPNVGKAADRTQLKSAYESARVLEVALVRHGRGPQAQTRLRTRTLEPLVSDGALMPWQRDEILGSFEGDSILWFARHAPKDGEEARWVLAFRPKGERDPTATCFVLPEGLWRWDAANGWHEPS